MYTNVKVIYNENVGQLYKLCRKSYYKMTFLFVFLWMIVALIILISTMYNLNLDEVFLCLAMLPAIVVSFIYIGNAAGSGELFFLPRRNSSIPDLLYFAKRFSLIPKTIQLSARIKYDNLTIRSICIEGKEIICTNSEGKTEVIELNESFKEEFKLYKQNDLSPEEIILDLSGNNLVAYVHPDYFQPERQKSD